MFHGHHDHEFIAHCHDYLTVILVTKGGVQIDIDRARYAVAAGQFVVIGAHQVHAARPIDGLGWEMRSLHLPPGLLFEDQASGNGSDRTIGFLKPVQDADGPAGPLFFEMHQCSETDRQPAPQGEGIQAFIDCLRRNLSAFHPKTVVRRPVDTDLQRAKDLIGEAAFDNTLIEFIAKEVGMSSYALIRRFRRSYGFSPHAWRIQMRANEAARLLRKGTALVEVAATCGFADQPHMARVFKKVFGVTPGQYRLLRHGY